MSDQNFDELYIYNFSVAKSIYTCVLYTYFLRQFVSKVLELENNTLFSISIESCNIKEVNEKA